MENQAVCPGGLSIAIADDDFTVFQRLSSTSADSALAIAFDLVQFYLLSFVPWWNASCRPYLVVTVFVEFSLVFFFYASGAS